MSAKIDQEINEPHPPCVICGGPNDQAEICENCAREYFMLPVDLEASGGCVVQDYHAARTDATQQTALC